MQLFLLLDSDGGKALRRAGRICWGSCGVVWYWDVVDKCFDQLRRDKLSDSSEAIPTKMWTVDQTVRFYLILGLINLF